MRRLAYVTSSAAFAGILVLAMAAGRPGTARVQAQGGLYDWTTDGGDIQRTGWNKQETTLTPANVRNLKLIWTVETDNEPRALHALMPVLVVGRLDTSGGTREVAFVSGISDNLYAIDVATREILWKRHWDYREVPGGRQGGGGGAGTVEPRRLNFLRPGGSSDTPVIGPADAQGRRPLYFVTGDGLLHTLNAATGEDLQPPYMFHAGKGWSLNLVGNVLWMQNTYAGISVAAVRLDDPTHKVMTYFSGSGGAWGRRGVTVDSTGIAWTTTGDGIYNPTANPPNYGNSVIGVHIVGDQLLLKDYFTPRNWEWLRKRDLDPNNTPTIFTYRGRELIAASGKECRVYLLDPKSPGGADHQTPLYQTPLFCNEEVDFQDQGSWGALSNWVDGNGTQWVLAPFWGPVHSQFKAPIMNTPPAKEGGVAAFKVEDVGGKTELTPAWVSRDMHRGEPVIVANGMVFGYGSGDETKQAWPDIGLTFDSSVRAAKAKIATIYVLDAQTGRELWNSGSAIRTFNHFSGITVANGRVYLSDYDGRVYCFGL
jgi:outer membrane protein assembly factor BamB